MILASILFMFATFGVAWFAVSDMHKFMNDHYVVYMMLYPTAQTKKLIDLYIGVMAILFAFGFVTAILMLVVVCQDVWRLV